MELIATHPILYHAKQYQVGQSLPTNDADMTKAWIEAGTAVWQEEEKKNPARALPATAEDGMAGQSQNEEAVESMVGKAPKTQARSRGARKNG